VHAHFGCCHPAIERVGHGDDFLVGDIVHMHNTAEQEGLALFQLPADKQDGLEADFVKRTVFVRAWLCLPHVLVFCSDLLDHFVDYL
jgi:hypothetical protein